MAIIGVGVTMPARPAPHPSIVVSRDIANGWMPIMTALPVSRIAGDNREPIGDIEHAKTGIFVSGRGDRIRTCDILLPKQARYRAALLPDYWSAP